MIKVITYGTYDLLHYGHIKLLERAKALGDYLIVGVTADDFDKMRGKINVQQSLIERVEAVRATGIADEIIIEEYEGQKIDDIRRYDVDIFTVGSDWQGKFDYLNEYCKVIYLGRTEGVSSSEIREQKRLLNLGLMGDSLFLKKVKNESVFVNGIQVSALYTQRPENIDEELKTIEVITDDFDKFMKNIDATYIRSLPINHYKHIKKALVSGKHVLCESPITLSKEQSRELFTLAISKKLILMEAIKTAYSTAFSRLLLLIKGGKIGEVISVDSTCTSLKTHKGEENNEWNGIFEWGPTALLPIFQILGTQFKDYKIVCCFSDDEQKYDSFTKMDFVYDNAVASIKVGDGVKSEGELIISGTKGYIYVPAPWWKTDYFEIRYENPADNRKYFYQLEGEGIRNELVAFVKAIERERAIANIDEAVTFKICDVMDDFVNKRNMIVLNKVYRQD
ncbi:MAG: adenylyltransferase/cytidyltransferase family protein [Lachnospiraceae bacterium]|nr:adenylyltransferase/cytidyltransferase family protein [Lachnospiraceae bacterium]